MVGPCGLRTDFNFLRSCEASTHVRGLGCDYNVLVYEDCFFSSRKGPYFFTVQVGGPGWRSPLCHPDQTAPAKDRG